MELKIRTKKEKIFTDELLNPIKLMIENGHVDILNIDLKDICCLGSSKSRLISIDHNMYNLTKKSYTELKKELRKIGREIVIL